MIRLPIGHSDSRSIIDEKFTFFDKTLFIKKVINERAKVILITRPRRFGKTLNLTMLEYFFAEKVYSIPTKGLFDGLKISRETLYEEYQGQFPVIFVSFKDVKAESFEKAYEQISSLFIHLYAEFSYLEKSDSLSETQKAFFCRILIREGDKSDLIKALQVLIECLFAHHKRKPIVLIDEYDTPIHFGSHKGVL
ncbi:MAG: AAA family ATPase [Proteobacteria bacterium]|nr:AAA family ATPase [Pseudomonadota bacterium]